ncbi:DUF3027 domain-containing protein [Microbacterium sp. NEAU-LLB]|uniref:DUF3027 domain-containing protein n=2 Tax=Microbacterium stercoris TaxID=2820289 RepID=A0A939QLE2_9MICO|nr:DUF3027 domain-containing protein [Microbacterium stercoris]
MTDEQDQTGERVDETPEPEVEAVETPEAERPEPEQPEPETAETPEQPAPETAETLEPEPLPEPDQRLLDAHDLALAALHEITPASSVGPAAGYSVERDGVVSLRFENTLLGYPGWFWTVSLAVVEGSDPTVLEAELLPGDGALLAPDWVPWAVRLKDYQVAQAAAAAEAAAAKAEAGEAAESDEDEDDDRFDDDLADERESILHAGDVDGVDIDAHDPDEQDDDPDEQDDDSDDEDSDDDDDDSDEDDDSDVDDDSDDDEDDEDDDSDDEDDDSDDDDDEDDSDDEDDD